MSTGGQGIVKKMVQDKGYGFITFDGGEDAFFHRSVVRDVAFEDLREGTRVFAETVNSEKGLRCEHVELADD